MRTIGLIGGTGLDNWGFVEAELQIETPYGSTSGRISEFHYPDTRLLFLPRHGKLHTIAPNSVNYRANIFALRQAGVERVIAVNAVGGITSRFVPGTLLVPTQLIDYTWGREHTFDDPHDMELNHVDFTWPFSAVVRDELLTAATEKDVKVIADACVGVTQGPRLETAAEIRKFEKDGCDVVGMTSMPEAGLARELGLNYASLAIVSNWGAGIADEELSMQSIERTLGDAMQKVRELLMQIINPRSD